MLFSRNDNSSFVLIYRWNSAFFSSLHSTSWNYCVSPPLTVISYGRQEIWQSSDGESEQNSGRLSSFTDVFWSNERSAKQRHSNKRWSNSSKFDQCIGKLMRRSLLKKSLFYKRHLDTSVEITYLIRQNMIESQVQVPKKNYKIRGSVFRMMWTASWIVI